MKNLVGKLLSVAAIAVVASCGDSGPTGPPDVLDGIWLYSTGEFQLPEGDTCRVSDLMFRIEQDGAHFIGTVVDEGSINCDGPGGPRAELTDFGIVSNGTFDGQRVSFQFIGDDITNEGTLTGSTMQGSVTIAADFLATTTFSAVKVE